MKGHNVDGILPGRAFGIHHQRDVLKEPDEVLERLHGAHEFLQVFQPPGCVRRAVLLPHLGIAALIQHDFRQLMMRHARHAFAPAVEIADELAQGEPHLGLQFFAADEFACGLDQRQLRRAGMVVDLPQRRVAEPALGHVDDALEGEIIGGRGDDTQIGQRIADFRPLIEARAANDAVVQPQRDKTVLKFAHLERGAHENGDLRETVALALQRLDLLADGARFLLAVPGARDGDLLAKLVLGEQRLAETTGIMGDEMRRRAKDVAGGAVIALQPDHRGAGKIALEAQDVVDLGAAPAIDRLVVIADAADIVRALREQPQPEILRDIGVLILIDQYVAKAAVIIRQHIRILAQQADALEQQVAEVDRVERLQPRLIGGIELLAAAIGKGGALASGDLIRREPAILPAVDRVGEQARRPALFVDILRLQQLLQQADLVVGVENGEAGFQPHQLGMAAQHAHADGVEGAEPRHALHLFADDGADALLHLARGLVGEGDGEDLRRPGEAERQDMGDAGSEDARLAGTGAGEHQHGTFRRLHRGALLRVQPAEIATGRSRSAAGIGKRRRARGNAPGTGRGNGNIGIWVARRGGRQLRGKIEGNVERIVARRFPVIGQGAARSHCSIRTSDSCRNKMASAGPFGEGGPVMPRIQGFRGAAAASSPANRGAARRRTSAGG